MMRLLLLAPALASLAACAHSPRTTLLALDAAQPSATGAHRDYRGPPLAIPAVHLPALLDRAEFVTRPAAGEAQVDDFSHWAAPLGLLVRDTLVRDLAARLPAGAVLPPGSVAGAGARAIDVTVVAFDAGSAGARLDAAWRQLPGGPLRQVSLTAPGDASSPPAAARALGDMLGQLADRIAEDVAGARPTS